nr:hypothetical protein CFP56_35209 [Quercus suber]
MAFHNNVLSPILLVLILISSGAKMCEPARVFTIINDCKETIWPAVTPGENFNGGGFTLKPKQSVVFTAPGLIMWSLSAHPGSNQCAPIITRSSSATPMDQRV